MTLHEGIYTFGECPDRDEHWRGEGTFGDGDSNDELCPDGSPLSMRNMDYSICLNSRNHSRKAHSCQIGRGSEVGVDTSRWCEAALCAKVCPRGYVR